MLQIREISIGKKQFLNLLLIGDEEERMIDRYIDRGHLFIGFIQGRPVACCVLTEEAEGVIEVKNLAVLPEHRRKGVGRTMLEYAESIFPGHTFMLGTGETPSTLRFYRNCGYTYSHTIPDFFRLNYSSPIIEEGVRLNDMLYLCKRPLKK